MRFVFGYAGIPIKVFDGIAKKKKALASQLPEAKPVTPSATPKELTYPPKNGARSPLITDLQKGLNRQGAKLTVDGIWGANTAQALDSYMDIQNFIVKDEDSLRAIIRQLVPV